MKNLTILLTLILSLSVFAEGPFLQLVERGHFLEAHKTALEYEADGKFIDVLTDKSSDGLSAFELLLKSKEPYAVNFTLFLLGSFSWNPNLTKEENLKEYRDFKKLDNMTPFKNYAYPFMLGPRREVSQKTLCPEYQKSLHDPCLHSSGGGGNRDFPTRWGEVREWDGGGYYPVILDRDPAPFINDNGGPSLGIGVGGRSSNDRGEPGNIFHNSENDEQPKEEQENEEQTSNAPSINDETPEEREQRIKETLKEEVAERIKEHTGEMPNLDEVEAQNIEQLKSRLEAKLSEDLLPPTKRPNYRTNLPISGNTLRRSIQNGYRISLSPREREGFADNPFLRSYEFASEDGDFKREAQSLYKKVNAISIPRSSNPLMDNTYQTRRFAKTYSLASIEAADQFNYLGDTELANFAIETAKTFAEVALGVLPGVSIVNSAYELFEGKNLVTGEELSNVSRALAGLGILTLGGSKMVTTGGKLLGKIGMRVLGPAFNSAVFKNIITKVDDFVDMAKRGFIEFKNARIKLPNKIKSFDRIKDNPLNNTTYTLKVRQQVELGDYHAFPYQVDNWAGLGKRIEITGRDGKKRLKVILEGSYDGKDGAFEWIIEGDRTVNHRLFKQHNR